MEKIIILYLEVKERLFKVEDLSLVVDFSLDEYHIIMEVS